MKIGIIGYWYATNYGSACTYYALYETIKVMGYTPIMIDIPEKEKDSEYGKSFARSFIENHCLVSDSVSWGDVESINNFADIFIIGSDQVWNQNAYRISRGLFYLKQIHDDKGKIAYAPSFGSDKMELNIDLEKEIGKNLSRFDAISVREDDGIEILKKRFGIDSERVIDPVFLLDAKHYRELKDESICSDYILAYILDPTTDKEEFIEKIEKHYKKPVRVILDGRYGTFENNRNKLKKYKDRSSQVGDVSEWITLIDDSDVVVTDSFHGMSLSILLGKTVYVYANHNRGYSRFTSLLNRLKIQDIMFESSKELDPRLDDYSIDYNNVNQIIESERRRSIEWIANAIRGKKPHSSITYNINTKLMCTGCGACYNACSSNSITISTNDDGFLNPVVDEESCIDCGSCASVCPIINPQYINDGDPDCFAVCANDEIREVSSSGGFFTVISEYILSNNGLVCGAEYGPDFQVNHTIIDDVNDLALLRGSKYIQSSTNLIYKAIESELRNNRVVLFTGMPCQVAGLRGYLNEEYDNLYTIDLLCHGISSYKVFSHYHRDVLEGKEIKKLEFKSKKPWGWHAGVNATFHDGSNYSCIIEDDPYFIAYISGLSKNKICGTCPFNKLPRQGDLTIGDFWKIHEYDPALNDNKGTSVVLINNDKGRTLFDCVNKLFPVCKEVPIGYAIKGNGCIKYPYRLHRCRDRFFDALDHSDYRTALANIRRLEFPKPIPPDMPRRLISLYKIAEIAYNNRHGRQVTIWGDNEVLRRILKKYFDISVNFIISSYSDSTDGWVRGSQYLENNKNTYVICYNKVYTKETEEYLGRIGLLNIKDYVFRTIKPITINNLDLSSGYSDEYGNVIKGKRGIIKQVILRGGNNSIEISDNVYGLTNVTFDLSTNSIITIGPHVNFTQSPVDINIQGYEGDSWINIQSHCRFMSALIRSFNDVNTTITSIGKYCTFGDCLRIHANSGKRVVINEGSMVSRDVVFWGGDGHSIFDVNTGKNINSVYTELDPARNSIIIGEHVWVGDGALLLYGTNIGDGSIIGARSVVKKGVKNNCTVVGNPARIIKEDVAWAYDMSTKDIGRCGKFARRTTIHNAPLSGVDVLVIGGTQQNDRALIDKLLSRGNRVTVANRGNHNDGLGKEVDVLILDVNKPSSITAALRGKHFDTVFNNVAYCSKTVDDVICSVSFDHYVQLSSVAVYERKTGTVTEEDYDPSGCELELTSQTGNYRFDKRQSEVAVICGHPNISATVVRIPYVCPTDRFKHYCDCVINGVEMKIDDLDLPMNFVSKHELADFMVWVAGQRYSGIINFASEGTITTRDIITYIELKTSKKAVVRERSGNNVPLGNPPYPCLDIALSEEIGYVPSDIDAWFWKELDQYIESCKKSHGNFP